MKYKKKVRTVLITLISIPILIFISICLAIYFDFTVDLIIAESIAKAYVLIAQKNDYTALAKLANEKSRPPLFLIEHFKKHSAFLHNKEIKDLKVVKHASGYSPSDKGPIALWVSFKYKDKQEKDWKEITWVVDTDTESSQENFRRFLYDAE